MNLPLIVVVGAGGHAAIVAEIILKSKKYQIVGHTAPEKPLTLPRPGFEYLGDDSVLPSLQRRGVTLAALGVGGVGDNRLRSRLYERVCSFGFSFPPLIHPAATVADGVLHAAGLVVAPGAVINPGVTVGVNTIINSAAVVEHDCLVGEHVHVAPGAVLCGGVRVGSLAHIGAGAVIIQGITLGEGAIVGAGAVVIDNVEPWVTVAGNPAKVIKKRGGGVIRCGG